MQNMLPKIFSYVAKILVIQSKLKSYSKHNKYTLSAHYM